MSQTLPMSSLVQALYSFKGTNNDELCFKKGDIITVTQKEDGGWWEGTLDTHTGWFPSNYVKPVTKQGFAIDTPKVPSPACGTPASYRNMVIKDLLDSEKAHAAELTALVNNFLHPLQSADFLTKEEYRQLVGNMDAVILLHKELLATLEGACNGTSLSEQRVGRVFLQMAPSLKHVHLAYCAAHPRSVCILSKHREALNTFMEKQGAANPGLLVLTTGLSKPFRRLEKYPGMLQELERHLEESHPDRGDTQRSVPVYKDIWSCCSTTRRQKEQELEILTTGVRGWEGEDLSSLGEILHMGSVAVGPDHRDRYLVLFPSTLLILSVSSRMSGFIYEGKLPLSGIKVSSLPDCDAYKNGFEISGRLIERILAVCQTPEEQRSWVESIKSAIECTTPSPVKGVLTRQGSEPMSNGKKGPCRWSITDLSPLPPLRTKPNTCKADLNFEEDIAILRVIETYCTNTNGRSSTTGGRPNFTNGRVRTSLLANSSSVTSKQRYVVDSIDLLKSQLCELRSTVSSLSLRLDDEIKNRALLNDKLELFLINNVQQLPDG